MRPAIMPLASVLMTAVLAAGCGDDRVSSPSPVGQGQPGGATTGVGLVPRSGARYVVTFDASWSRASHPTDFPGSAHFSALVGGTHNSAVSFWSEGREASNGIRDMAERGRTSPLDQEVAAAVAAGTAGAVILGGGIGTSPGSASVEFSTEPAFPLVTLVSMVAPSPDWFVGVTGLSLVLDGDWVAERRVDLVPWDAGTDSGTTFTSADQVTSPRGVVRPLLSAPLSPGGVVRSLGSFVFRRLQ